MVHQASEIEKSAQIDKSICDDAISNSFILNTTYTAPQQQNPNANNDQEFELLQPQPSAYFGGQNEEEWQES